MVSVVIGEGGSGGAIAIAAANRVLMMEYAIYSVISPEGCASILWRSADYAKEAAEALKMTAQDLLEFGVIDSIIPEPLGAAHRGGSEAIRAVGDAVEENIRQLDELDGATLRSRRRERFLTLGNDALTA
jgi:acetyl-CoA carboxylase carboxyl transferase subunit alpha